MTIAQLIAQLRSQVAEKLATRNQKADELRALLVGEEQDETAIAELRAAKKSLDDEVDALQARVADLEQEQARDDAADRLAREVQPGTDGPEAEEREQRAQVNEKRTYSKDSDPKGMQFLRDVAMSFTGNGMASMRLAQHMTEEIHERHAAGHPLVERDSGRIVTPGPSDERAVGTGAFSGLVIPQYLTDLVAPHAKAGRPFADSCRHHDLPEQGMTVNISKITTGTDTGLQANEGDAATEQNVDDTLLTIPVQTNAGQQSISRQAIERGAGIEDTTLEDLYRSHGTRLSSTLLNQGTTGLSAVATSIAYTDASPTAAELYPKTLQAPAAVEAALLDQDPGDTYGVMHSRRWYWLQSQMGSTWPLFGQPGIGAQQGGVNYGERYGSGFRGVLPNGTPVIVDNNIATNLGGGTNEDEMYFLAQSEAHLWEDPNAPMLIRAEQTKAATLQVLLVVYSYFAYTFTRRAHAQKIGGTGLVTPTF